MADWGNIAIGATQGMNQGLHTIAELQQIKHRNDQTERENNLYQLQMKNLQDAEQPVFVDRIREQYKDSPNMFKTLYQDALTRGDINNAGTPTESIKKGNLKNLLAPLQNPALLKIKYGDTMLEDANLAETNARNNLMNATGKDRDTAAIQLQGAIKKRDNVRQLLGVEAKPLSAKDQILGGAAKELESLKTAYDNTTDEATKGLLKTRIDTLDEEVKQGAGMRVKPEGDNLSYHIEKQSIGGNKTQDYRVFVDKSGNVTKREPMGAPYANSAGVAAININRYDKPNQNTGVVYKPSDGKWHLPTENGDVILTGEQVKNLGLQTKEEATSSDIKSMQQSAPAVLDFVGKMKKEISDAEKGLGPMASRWREFKQGKVGLEDPAFTELKTNAELLVTRLMKMHVGARGSEYIMQEFKKMIALGKQSPENLKASLKQIEDYANEAGKGRFPDLYKKVNEGGDNNTPAPSSGGYRWENGKLIKN